MIQQHMIPCSDRLLATSVDLPDTFDHATLRYPVVIITHGLTGNRIGVHYDLVEFASKLNDAGIICVRFDQSGCGESSGQFIDHTIPRIKEDLQSIRSWVTSQSWCDTKRLGYVGQSLGALPTIAVDAEHPSRGIALWAPVYNMPRVFKKTAKTGLRAIMEHQGWVPFKGLPIGKGFIDTLNTINPDDLIKESSAPILLCHSQADDTSPFEESENYELTCRQSSRLCQLIKFSTANHTFSDWNDRHKLIDTTVEFFQEQLRTLAI
ncbi:prolyl oligopeptidase family serine peptidase [Planctomycetota bacterium]|nr:prolyl oligopeptidase family serine peptidase [Planctomycetota bacterium]